NHAAGEFGTYRATWHPGQCGGRGSLFLGDPRPFFSSLFLLMIQCAAMALSRLIRVRSLFAFFLQFLSRLIRSRLAALRHRSPQYLAGKREAKLSNVQANQNLLAAPEGAPLGCKPLHGPAQG